MIVKTERYMVNRFLFYWVVLFLHSFNASCKCAEHLISILKAGPTKADTATEVCAKSRHPPSAAALAVNTS